jgi:NTP pyrophosphatase (non-canonical NTP hydrolase)
MMELKQIIERAMQIRQQYDALETEQWGRHWTREEIALGFVGDVGDLMKLVAAKEGVRKIDNVDEKLAHELADCLWSICVLSDLYQIDLEAAFASTMNEIENHIANRK